MMLKDYETGRALVDVGIVLTRDEAEDMMAFLGRLLEDAEVKRAHVSEIQDCRLMREITLSVNDVSYAETA